ncbi:ATP-binding protein [candidate division KSB1 bacterium]
MFRRLRTRPHTENELHDVVVNPDYNELKRRHVFRLTLIYLLPLIFLTTYFFFETRRIIQKSTNVEMTSAAVRHSSLLDLYLLEKITILSNLIDSPDFPLPPSSRYMEEILEILKIDSDAFIDAGFFDSSGVQIEYAGQFTELEMRDYSYRNWYLALKESDKEYIITDLHLGFRGRPHFTLGVRRIKSGKYVVLRATIDPEKFYGYLSSLEGAQEYTAYVVNKEGYYQVVSANIGEPFTAAEYIPPSDPRVGIAEFDDNSSRSPVAYSWLNIAEWALILQWTNESSSSGISREMINPLLMSLLLFSVLFTFILFLAGKLVAFQRERDETRAQLEHAERMLSIGQLAAGIAHEINNPLTGVLTSGHMLLKKSPPDHPDREDLEIIVNETTRCREITRNLLDFARQRPAKKTPVDLKAVLDRTLSILSNQIKKHNIRIIQHIDENLPRLMLDEGQIEQVFLNIVLNAVEAMPDDGEIYITTWQMENQVEITFRDTGHGIPEKHLEKIFDPFFTTKSKTRGTGLGLAVSYGIVSKHNGSIRAKSKENEGTSFTVTLPLEKNVS